MMMNGDKVTSSITSRGIIIKRDLKSKKVRARNENQKRKCPCIDCTTGMEQSATTKGCQVEIQNGLVL